MIVCSCGCKVEDFDGLVQLAIKDYTRDDIPCVTYGSYCQKCALRLDPSLILSSHEEEVDWMHNGSSRDEIDIDELLDIKKKWDWLCKNVKEVPLDEKRFVSPFADRRLKWELPILVSFGCTGDSISFNKAVENAMGEYNDE